MRFQGVDSFMAWARGNEARYPIRIHNIGAIPTYPEELEIADQKALEDLEKDGGKVSYFCQSLKDAVDYIPVSQAQ